jgi:hypothetical protein
MPLVLERFERPFHSLRARQPAVRRVTAANLGQDGGG